MTLKVWFERIRLSSHPESDHNLGGVQVRPLRIDDERRVSGKMAYKGNFSLVAHAKATPTWQGQAEQMRGRGMTYPTSKRHVTVRSAACADASGWVSQQNQRESCVQMTRVTIDGAKQSTSRADSYRPSLHHGVGDPHEPRMRYGQGDLHKNLLC